MGELAALGRADIDAAGRRVHVRQSLTELPGGGYAYGPPKPDAGHRQLLIPGCDRRRAAHAPGRPRTAGPGRARVHRPYRRDAATRELPPPGLAASTRTGGRAGHPFHDLRHTGNILTTDAGANLRELMGRMGHSTTRAALIYLHTTSERQRRIADGLGELARAELAKVRKSRRTSEASGTDLARRRETSSARAGGRGGQVPSEQGQRFCDRGRPERDSNARPTA
jgi:integrase